LYFSVSFFKSKIENPWSEQISQRLGALAIGNLQSLCYELRWIFALNHTLIGVHTKERYHQDAGKNVESFLKNKELDLF
jgi:hypothetical protein